MTIQEASERYHIPMDILKEYESWGLCGAVKKVMGAWQYDDTDLERLSLIMTLHDIGFDRTEIETYMRLLLEREGTDGQRMRMLNQKRRNLLDDIHFREKQLSRLDDLRYYIQKQQKI
ncbi:MAG TPA: MerR family transcriptional regulator [Candidatus Merdivicinus excrementipullorum]|uniref:MerR family transcriptional regulator n=1 Tax=Candidatus Merdivicinus excrementipullorum TaxID=2840867 RepID=A0A9D1FKR3_9FIRM|nr:MerR family transcriptional regulator [Candidatus Merdivicinus excrementipullorum]